MTADIVIVLAGVCGLLMVVGGLGLFYKGAITLTDHMHRRERVWHCRRAVHPRVSCRLIPDETKGYVISTVRGLCGPLEVSA